jgi:hypothetical protein
MSVGSLAYPTDQRSAQGHHYRREDVAGQGRGKGFPQPFVIGPEPIEFALETSACGLQSLALIGQVRPDASRRYLRTQCTRPG